MRLARSAALWLFITGLAAGCNGSQSNRLFGSASTIYNLDFTSVRVNKQVIGGVFKAMVLEYVNERKSSAEIPVKVVANAPVTEGQQKDLVKEGAVYRVMGDGSQFKAMQKGTITFEDLPDPGGDCSGEFYITFVEGGITLNGEFSATLGKLGD